MQSLDVDCYQMINSSRSTVCHYNDKQSLPLPLPLTVSCFSKIQTGFTFLVPAHPCSPGKGAVKRVCVCVCIIIRNVAGVSGDGAYCKDSVGALAERAVVGRVDRRLSSEPRVKLTHVRLIALHQDTKRTTF